MLGEGEASAAGEAALAMAPGTASEAALGTASEEELAPPDEAPSGYEAYTKGYKDGQAGIAFDPIPGSFPIADPAIEGTPARGEAAREESEKIPEEEQIALNETRRPETEQGGGMNVTVRMMMFEEEAPTRAPPGAIPGPWDSKGQRGFDWVA